MTETTTKPATATTDRERIDPAQRYGTAPCCANASRLDCICRAAWHCREHGSWHVGTHD